MNHHPSPDSGLIPFTGSLSAIDLGGESKGMRLPVGRGLIRSPGTSSVDLHQPASTTNTNHHLQSSLTWNLSASYERPISSDLKGFAQINYFWRDDVSFSAAGDPSRGRSPPQATTPS